MSEPDNPRWVEELGPELRAPVPVREAWRARLLEEVAREPRPAAAQAEYSGRRIVLRPLTGLAAAVVFAALGAGATIAALAWRAHDETTAARVSASRANVGGAQGSQDARMVSDVGGPGVADPEVVRFALSAPNATHVALVGSFNRWNPVATPLARDPRTGTWTVAVRLPPGRHVYAFVVDGDVTADPDAPRAADDDFGSANSVVLVGGKAS